MKTSEIARLLKISERHARRLKEAGDERVQALESGERNAGSLPMMLEVLDIAKEFWASNPDLFGNAIKVAEALAKLGLRLDIAQDIGRAVAGVLVKLDALQQTFTAHGDAILAAIDLPEPPETPPPPPAPESPRPPDAP
jgi:hypothetical protein